MTATTTRRKALVADLALFSVAIFWGFNFVVIKNVTAHLTHTVSAFGEGVVAATLLYLFFRYVTATLIFSAIQPKALIRATRAQWGMGGLLGGFYLTALVYWAVARRSPGWFQALGAIVATIGLGFLSLRGNLTVSWGDALTLLGALLYGLHIMTTGFFAPKVPPSTLAVTQMAVSTALLLVVTPLVAHITLALGWQAWAAILWTALSGTIYAFFIQSWAQRYTTSTHAAVLLCFESVFAALSGVIFGMDTVTWRMVTGASLIFTGMLLIELLPGAGGENEAPAEALVPIESGDRERAAGPGSDQGRSGR
jgi:drug/metabolite transporter (DMT)-like permease